MMPSPHPRESTTRIFISYRRSESIPQVGRLHDRLSERFGQRPIFIDYESVELGRDFIEAIEKAVGSCRVLLAVIGRDWLTCSDEQGRRRLDDPEDFVRLEVATALKRRDVRVIPVLVQGAVMPSRKDLPDDMAALVRRQACKVGDLSWNDDVENLIEKISADVRSPKLKLVAGAGVALALLLLALIFVAPGTFRALFGTRAQQPTSHGDEPFTKKNFIEMLEADKGSARKMTKAELVGRAQKHGAKFKVTPLNEGEIRKAGDYLSSSDLDGLIETLKANYRPATSLSGTIEQVRVVDDPGGEFIHVFVRLSISNVGPPSVAQDYKLSVVLANSPTLQIRGWSPSALKEPFNVTGDGGPEVIIRPDDDLAQKTAQDIQKGQPVSGWLRFLLPQARQGPGKPQLKAEFLRQRGVWYVVSFDDWAKEPFEATFNL